jgi:hypothetical protein
MRSKVLGNNGMKSWSLVRESQLGRGGLQLTAEGNAHNATEQLGGLHCISDPRRKTKHAWIQTNFGQKSGRSSILRC